MIESQHERLQAKLTAASIDVTRSITSVNSRLDGLSNERKFTTAALQHSGCRLQATRAIRPKQQQRPQNSSLHPRSKELRIQNKVLRNYSIDLQAAKKAFTPQPAKADMDTVLETIARLERETTQNSLRTCQLLFEIEECLKLKHQAVPHTSQILDTIHTNVVQELQPTTLDLLGKGMQSLGAACSSL